MRISMLGPSSWHLNAMVAARILHVGRLDGGLVSTWRYNVASFVRVSMEPWYREKEVGKWDGVGIDFRRCASREQPS